VIEMLGDSLTAATILPVPPAQRLRELLHDEYDVQALLTQAVGDAKKAGTVYVVGVIRSVPFELPSAATDRIKREVAGAEGVPFINLRDLPFDPVTDTADSLHPSQSYSDRIMKRVADVLRAGGP
jgi:hypothetical protein